MSITIVRTGFRIEDYGDELFAVPEQTSSGRRTLAENDGAAFEASSSPARERVPFHSTA